MGTVVWREGRVRFQALVVAKDRFQCLPKAADCRMVLVSSSAGLPCPAKEPRNRCRRHHKYLLITSINRKRASWG